MDVTQETGLNQNNSRYTLSASWNDFDLDGDQDLYVANDFGRNNLYRNDEGKFIDIAAEAGVEDLSAGMGVCWGDYNQDGLMDLYVSNMFSSAGNRVATSVSFALRIPVRREPNSNVMLVGIRCSKTWVTVRFAM